MSQNFSEADWKLLRELHPIALNRYCQKALEDIKQIADDADKSPHETDLEIYKAVQSQDQDIRLGFTICAVQRRGFGS